MKLSVVDKVLPALTKKPGEIVHVNDLAEEAGVTKEQVQTAMNNLRKRAELEDVISVVVTGHAWMYRPHGQASVTVVPSAPVEASINQEAPAQPEAATRAKRSKRRQNRVFEEIGENRDGKIILRADNGDLYAAELL